MLLNSPVGSARTLIRRITRTAAVSTIAVVALGAASSNANTAILSGAGLTTASAATAGHSMSTTRISRTTEPAAQARRTPTAATVKATARAAAKAAATSEAKARTRASNQARALASTTKSMEPSARSQTAWSTRVRAVTPTPSRASTGVPAGTTLTVHEGDINITQAGTVIDGLDVHGAIKVNAPNVTIKNSIIRFRVGGYTAGIQSYSTGLSISDVEIAPTTISSNYNGVMGSGFTLTRANIHHVVDGVHIYGNNVVIRDSWVHDNSHFLNDPNWGGKPSHDDSIQIVKGSNILITGTTYAGAYNSGIQVTQDSGVVSNLTISNNNADGGGCTINLSEKGGGPLQGVVINNNSFGGHQRVANCAIIRPTTTTVTNSGNTWASTGAAVVLSRG